MFNKDVVVPGRMRRKIHNPRILLLDCPLEYKKGENQTNVEIMKEEDWCVHDRVDPKPCCKLRLHLQWYVQNAELRNRVG
jgi:hypothetical protein